VILGQLDRLSLADHVHSAIAHVGDEAPFANHQERGKGGTHAALFWFPLGLVEDRYTRGLYGIFQNGQHIMCGYTRFMSAEGFQDIAAVVYRGAEVLYCNFRGDLPRRMPTHSVGHDE